MGQLQSARLAQYNRSVVLTLIRLGGPIAKAELAERSGLAVSSVMNIVTSLSRRGLVRTVGMGPSTGGRPPVLLELNPNAHYAVGVNMRADTVEAVLVDFVADIVAETRLAVPEGSDVESLIGLIAESVDQVAQLARVDPGRVIGVGVGCPGPIRDGRMVASIPSLPGWKNVPLASRLERLIGLPVTLENDANLGALAEFRYGAGQKTQVAESLVYVYADYGIGSGIVIDGILYRGRDGMAGEVGHTVVDVDGPQCTCGNYGCLEAMASVGSIIRRTSVIGKLGGHTTLGDAVDGDWDRVDFAAVCSAIERDDPVARGALDQAIMYLAVGITNLMRQFRPHRVVVGGQLLDVGPTVIERLEQAIYNRPPFYTLEPIPLVVSQLGNHAMAIGAATLILENFFGVPERVMSIGADPQAPEPAFDKALQWPMQEQGAIVLNRSAARIAWSGNVRPVSVRVRSGAAVIVTLDVGLEIADGENDHPVKVLLHWDRVPYFGGNWSHPKNSPMQLMAQNGTKYSYSVSLGALPPGKYEFAARILAANDKWVRSDDGPDVNARVEVVSNRAFSEQTSQDLELLPSMSQRVEHEPLTG